MARALAFPAQSRERALAGLLAAVAGLRVFLFAAAFPFFSNVDEHRHIDMVLKYARGYWPAPGTEAYEPEMASLLGVYGSPEYHRPPDSERPLSPPASRRDPAVTVRMIERNERFLDARPNLEAFQPPVYYATAGLWMRLGRGLGIEGGYLLYWVRALNAGAYAMLVLLCWASLREIYPPGAFPRLAVPALLAVFPQDALYYVTRDAFSPLLAGAALFAVIRVARRPDLGPASYAMAGIAAGVAVLGKYTNGIVLPVAALGSIVALRSAQPEARGRCAGKLLLLWALALILVGGWLLRNQLVFGELLVTSGKLERLGWGRKPFSEWWGHPIFTPWGMWVFVTDLLPTFWRGELAWNRRTLALGGADIFYSVTSLSCLALACIGWLRRRDAPGPRMAEGLSIAAVASAAAVLIGLSMMFVFGENTNPTADRPFFIQGRLVAGVLVPFVLLYVRGIEVGASVLGPRLRLRAAWICLMAVAAVAIGSELYLSAEVFASEYNWFHLP